MKYTEADFIIEQTINKSNLYPEVLNTNTQYSLRILIQLQFVKSVKNSETE